MVDFVDTRYGPNGGSREWKGSAQVRRIEFLFVSSWLLLLSLRWIRLCVGLASN